MDLGSILSAGLQGLGIYQQQKAQDKYYDQLAKADADKQQLANDQYNYELQVAQLMKGGSSGGGGGGGRSAPKFTPEMLGIYKDYMNRAEALYKPTIDAAAPLLPKATTAYGSALDGVSSLLKAYQSPEMLQRMNQSTPASSIAYNIPRKR